MRRKRTYFIVAILAVLILISGGITLISSGIVLRKLIPDRAVKSSISISGLHVSGNRLLNNANQVVRTLGVNRSGSEYECEAAGNTKVFDGPSDAASVEAMTSWDINTVRVPLNEDCWLGINGYPAAQYSATQYQQAIINYVHLLNANHLIAIVDLQWNGPGTYLSNEIHSMPDLDHAPAFWTSVASTFMHDSSVILDLFNEPHPSNWSCWLNGSAVSHGSPCDSIGFATAGMQMLINTVRATGATNVIMLGGLDYANDLSGWLTHLPIDPLNNMVASFHLYNFNPCNSDSCWNRQVAPVAAQVPVIVGELGENDCKSTFINTSMDWFDQHDIGYLAWGWDVYNCGSFPSLITSYDGTPTRYGQGFKTHLTALGDGLIPTPVLITPTPGT